MHSQPDRCWLESWPSGRPSWEFNIEANNADAIQSRRCAMVPEMPTGPFLYRLKRPVAKRNHGCTVRVARLQGKSKLNTDHRCRARGRIGQSGSYR
jgi:hypothetical protein